MTKTAHPPSEYPIGTLALPDDLNREIRQMRESFWVFACFAVVFGKVVAGVIFISLTRVCDGSVTRL